MGKDKQLYVSTKLHFIKTASTMMLTGRLIASIGLGLGLALTLGGLIGPVVLFGAAVFGGIGNGLTIPAANVNAMAVVARAAGSAAFSSADAGLEGR